jgi:hypothetical protein
MQEFFEFIQNVDGVNNHGSFDDGLPDFYRRGYLSLRSRHRKVASRKECFEGLAVDITKTEDRVTFECGSGRETSGAFCASQQIYRTDPPSRNGDDLRCSRARIDRRVLRCEAQEIGSVIIGDNRVYKSKFPVIAHCDKRKILPNPPLQKEGMKG